MKCKDNIIHTTLTLLPEKPGVYLFHDKNQKIIYVGKAKNLKKRVTSYFGGKYESGKTRTLVANICDIKYVVVDTESDALLLENNLIKQYQPRYNVRLKDDKSFPWIVIKNEHFPRVYYTRNVSKDGSLYFGPYTSTVIVKTILELVRKLFPLRTCNYNLNPEIIAQKKYKVCLEYHIGNCLGPCEGYQKEDDYNKGIEEIKNIVKGNTKQVINYLYKLMIDYGNEYKFEQAQEVKEKLAMLQNFQSKSTIVSPSINNVDVFSFLDEETYAYVNYMKVMHGGIVQVHSVEIKKQIDEIKEDVFSTTIIELRKRLHSDAKEILLPFKLNYVIPFAKTTVPQKGEKKKLVELSQRNVRQFKKEATEKRYTKKGELTKEKRILQTVKKDLLLDNLPFHMECFDNSNIQGSNPVAACVVFKNAKPAKKEYRHFHVKSVEGIDDYASMKEIVYRRYKRITEEKKQLPQLIVVDGGKGQLNAAYEVLENLKIQNKVTLIGIAKRLEEIYKPHDPVPLFLDKSSETLRIIQHMRNEAHRFAITFHRNVRSKKFIESSLDNIPGIGEKTIEQLMQHFGSMNNIKKADQNQLEKMIGRHKAIKIFNYFRNKSQN